MSHLLTLLFILVNEPAEPITEAPGDEASEQDTEIVEPEADRVEGPPLLDSGPSEALDAQIPVSAEVPRLRIGRLGVTGATIAAGGAGVIIAGLLTLSHPDSREYIIRHSRSPGAAALALGVVGVSAGVTMLAFDLAVVSRHRSPHELSLHVDFGPSSGGLWLAGRF